MRPFPPMLNSKWVNFAEPDSTDLYYLCDSAPKKILKTEATAIDHLSLFAPEETLSLALFAERGPFEALPLMINIQTRQKKLF